jgi:8-oxo-dGTP diphosphatase
MKIINEFLKENKSFEKKDSVKAIVFCPQKKILILRRQEGEGGAGNWDFPGGGIETGEDQAAALKREVFEETNLQIKDISKVKDMTLKIPEHGINSLMHIYKCKTENIDVQLKPSTWVGAGGRAEHNELKWVSKKHEVENLPMLDQLKEVLLNQLK